MVQEPNLFFGNFNAWKDLKLLLEKQKKNIEQNENFMPPPPIGVTKFTFLGSKPKLGK